MVVVLPAPVGPTRANTPGFTVLSLSTTGRCLSSSASGMLDGSPRLVRRGASAASARGDVRRDIHRRQLLEHARLQRLAQALVVPRDVRELALQKPAQILDLALHARESSTRLIGGRRRSHDRCEHGGGRAPLRGRALHRIRGASRPWHRRALCRGRTRRDTRRRRRRPLRGGSHCSPLSRGLGRGSRSRRLGSRRSRGLRRRGGGQ